MKDMYIEDNYPPIPSLKPANILSKPEGEKYQTANRLWQGCPSIAKTKGGRLYAAWFSGGVKEPGYGSFNLVFYSDDDGLTWNENYIVVEADEEHYDHATDINLWIAPDGALYVTYVQCRLLDTLLPIDQIWTFYDGIWGSWVLRCADPDAENPQFEEPVRWCDGFLRNQPTVLSTGEWIAPAYDWLPPVFVETASFLGIGNAKYKYHFRISDDCGKTWRVVTGPDKPQLIVFDEIMILEGKEGEWHFFARTEWGILHSLSRDRGETWEDTDPAWMPGAGSRFFVRRLSSGNILLVHSGGGRHSLLAKISTDECKTWSELLVLDDRASVSYPDGMQDDEGNIYIAYDRERYGAREILFAKFTEEDIKAKELVTPTSYTKRLINKLTAEREQ